MNLEKFLDEELDKDTMDVHIFTAEGEKISDPDYHLYDIDKVSYHKMAIIHLKPKRKE